MFANTSVVLLFAGFLVGVPGCKKSGGSDKPPETEADSFYYSVLGSWNWVLTINDGIYTGAFTGNPLGDSATPSSVGYRETLTFNPDSTWVLLQNCAAVDRGTFTFKQVINPGGALNEGPLIMLDLIRAGGPDSILNHYFLHDTLILNVPLVDSVQRNWEYVKTNGPCVVSPD